MLPFPEVVDARPRLVSDRVEVDGVSLAGARIAFRSEHPVSAWEPVVTAPERQDDWQSPSLGLQRAERLDATHVFQQMQFDLFFGAVRIQRQVIVDIRWQERTDAHLHNCWVAADPAPFRAALAPMDNAAPWVGHGAGGWEIHPLPDGGTYVSYQFWAESALLPPRMQAWGMSRTLPDLMAAFDAEVGRRRAR